MSVFVSFILLVAVGFLLHFVSQSAKRLEFKKHSLLWIGFIWGVSIGATLLFRQYYDVPVVIYIFFSTGIATITYLLLANTDIPASLLFSMSNTAVLLAVMFYFGMLGDQTKSTLTSGDVQLVADEICQCTINKSCSDEVLANMEKVIIESQVLEGDAAIIATNAVTRANHCRRENPVNSARESVVTFLDDWEMAQNKDKQMRENVVLKKPSLFASVVEQPSIAVAVPTIEFEVIEVINVTALNKHLGDILRLTKFNGNVLKGWLIADEGGKIIVKQKLSGGYVHMPILKTSISLLEVKSDDVTR